MENELLESGAVGWVLHDETHLSDHHRQLGQGSDVLAHAKLAHPLQAFLTNEQVPRRGEGRGTSVANHHDHVSWLVRRYSAEYRRGPCSIVILS